MTATFSGYTHAGQHDDQSTAPDNNASTQRHQEQEAPVEDLIGDMLSGDVAREVVACREMFELEQFPADATARLA